MVPPPQRGDGRTYRRRRRLRPGRLPARIRRARRAAKPGACVAVTFPCRRSCWTIRHTGPISHTPMQETGTTDTLSAMPSWRRAFTTAGSASRAPSSLHHPPWQNWTVKNDSVWLLRRQSGQSAANEPPLHPASRVVVGASHWGHLAGSSQLNMRRARCTLYRLRRLVECRGWRPAWRGGAGLVTLTPRIVAALSRLVQGGGQGGEARAGWT